MQRDMRRLLEVVAAAHLTMSGVASGQALPVVARADVAVTVTTSPNETLTYTYAVSNPPQNTGSLWLFAVDIRRAPNTQELSDNDLDSDARLTLATTQVVLESIGNELVPVGVQTPAGWHGSLTMSGSVEWGAPDDTPPLAPGQQIAGFSLVSRGLPGLRTATVEAYVPLEELPIAPPSDESDLERYDNELAALQAKLTVSTTTIGPIAPPLDFNAVEFLETILTYKQQVAQLRWMTDRGIGNSLDAKLHAALAALTRGNNRAAVNVLNALLHEVDAQAGKQLSPEAVALLKFNTQYLIRKIQ